MGDAGEGLIDADSRIQERMEELEQERAAKRAHVPHDPEALRLHESLRLARAELQRQLESTAHERRRAQITLALADLDRRMKEVSARLGGAS
jgi:hypothetical protein